MKSFGSLQYMRVQNGWFAKGGRKGRGKIKKPSARLRLCGRPLMQLLRFGGEDIVDNFLQRVGGIVQRKRFLTV